jgi:hypothetical protein
VPVRAARGLSDADRHPVENRLDELWSQLHFANPGLLGTLADFRERYARPIADGEPGAAAHLRARIAPFLLRRLKRVVARELPPRTEAVLHCELDAEERAVYDTVRAASQRDVVERLARGGNVLEALELLLRLRQAACHRALVPGQSATSSSKVEVLLEALEEAVAEDHKALVFSQWTSLLDRVEPALRAAGIAFARLDGSTPDRQAVVRQFQAEDAPSYDLARAAARPEPIAADHVPADWVDVETRRRPRPPGRASARSRPTAWSYATRSKADPPAAGAQARPGGGGPVWHGSRNRHHQRGLAGPTCVRPIT